MANKQKISYIFDPDIYDYHYGSGHPMKPQRLSLTHSLIKSYGLDQFMDVVHPHYATTDEITQYHSPKYIHHLKHNTQTHFKQIEEFNLADFGDCPMFPGVYKFCQSSVGATIDCARLLNTKLSNICINWSGGLHHARKNEAAGFGYTNDIVIGILELLKVHKRVLYIDIDIHHGDGVEEAFYHTNRVFTLSFHRYGDEFFPGTGSIKDTGSQEGVNCTANFPLKDGITDDQFKSIFEPILDSIINNFAPDCIVLQCGADSLIGDRLGGFCLSVQGHSACVEYVKNLNVPLMVLGGGGYTVSNVARCWLYETAVLLDKTSEISGKDFKIPKSDGFYEYYSPEYSLDLVYKVKPMNANVDEVLEKNKQQLLRSINALNGPPSVQMQSPH